MLETLQSQVKKLGKEPWRAMLAYTADLHARSTHRPTGLLTHRWEEIGPGYCYAPAFGHWDIVHAVLDVLPWEHVHASHQLLNSLGLQQADGMLPAVVFFRDDEATFSRETTHPPVWPIALEMCWLTGGEDDLIRHGFDAVRRQIEWFEARRKAEPHGYFYRDILDKKWESGVDEGVRFADAPRGRAACVDATAHVYLMYEYARIWAQRLGQDPQGYSRAAAAIRDFIQNGLFDEETGFFHDVWAVGRPQQRRMALEGMWPVVVGAADGQQARRAIDENLLEPSRFFSVHPVATVGVEDPAFELRMWRGPAWNSMTCWAAMGCLRYGRGDAACRLLEAALDASAGVFDETETIWEFYHPHGGRPDELRRKPHTNNDRPCRDYLGHNPLIAMARLWEQAAEAQ